MPGEKQLSDVLSEFARTMVTDFPIQAILDHLVERIVEVLPITGAGVTLISPGTDPRYVAASNAAALRFEELQTELAEGPCLAAYYSGDAVSVDRLRGDTRFPRFAPRAVEAGLEAVFTFPLRHGREQLGALDLYRDAPGPLDADTMEIAQTLADVAASYLLNARARADLLESTDRSRMTALHDALTGLPNRILLLERLDHAVLRCRRSGTLAAVLYADLDRFKAVNDLYGHAVGDQLLVAVARRLSALLRPGDTLARMSGDEFVILCDELDDSAQVEAIAARIGRAFEPPFALSPGEVHVSASVGIAFSGPGSELSEQLIQDADSAMYQAKREGGARHQLVDLRDQHLTARRAGLERDLQDAMRLGELRTEYQPIVDTAGGRLRGVEALLRWAHPTCGLVLPSTLIPLAEQSGLITGIGRWVLAQACTDRRGWQRGTQADRLSMAVNVSAHQLMSPGYVASVADVLSDVAIEPEHVTLEVTETVFIHDSDRALVVLKELKELGVMLALDDFGTGYSSLNYLKRFPIDIVKIDRGFVADLESDPASRAIVFAVVELAHMLGMTVVAEGVETAAQLELLQSMGCDQSQGFYFARPVTASSIDKMLERHGGELATHLPVLAAVSQ